MATSFNSPFQTFSANQNSILIGSKMFLTLVA